MGPAKRRPSFIAAKELAGFAQPLVSAPDGPKPQVEFLHGLEVTSEFFASRGLTALAGSLFTEADIGRGEPILVLGSRLGETLFEDGVSVDRQVLSLNRLYRIVGVLAPTGTEVDEQAFTPRAAGRGPNRGLRLQGGYGIPACDSRSPTRRTWTKRARNWPSTSQPPTGKVPYRSAYRGPEAQSTTDRYRRLVRIILFLALSALLIAAVNMTNLFYSRAVRRQRSVGILKAVGASVAQVFAGVLSGGAHRRRCRSRGGHGIGGVLSRLMEQTIGFGALHVGLIIVGVAAAWTIVAACNMLPAAAAARMPAADAIRYE